MLKYLSFVLLSSIMVPSVMSINSSTFSHEPEMVVLDGDEEEDPNSYHGYHFNDIEDYSGKTRVFVEHDLTPSIIQSFCAPQGYVFTLKITEEQVDEILYQADHLNANYDYFGVQYKYTTFGSDIYMDSDFTYGSDGDDEETRAANRLLARNTLLNYFNNRLLFKMGKAVVENDISLWFEFTFYTVENQCWQFRFIGDTLHIQPFDVADFIEFSTMVYEQYDEKRTTVYAEPIEGFFYEGSEPNDYGFHTKRPSNLVELDHITMEGQTTTFELGDTFVFDGTVTAYYSNSTKTKTLGANDVAVWSLYEEGGNIYKGSTLQKTGNFNVLVAYYDSECNVQKRIAFVVTVIDPDHPDAELDPAPAYEIEEEIRAYYTMTLIANDSYPIKEFDGGSVEVWNYPSEELTCKIKIEFIDQDGKEYEFYSRPFLLSDPDVSVTIDGDVGRESIERNSLHTFSFHVNNYVPGDLMLSGYVNASPIRLNDPVLGYEIYSGELPETGEEGYYYYKASANEIALHEAGRDEEFLDKPAEGIYYTWDAENQEFKEYQGAIVLESSSMFEEADMPESVSSIPFVGTWRFNVMFVSVSQSSTWNIESNWQTIEVTSPSPTEDAIILNMPDNINLVDGAGEIDIIPTITTQEDNVEYYYDYQLSKTGVVEIVEGENGKLTVNPINSGVVELTITCESILFSKITKTVSIRVLDSIYDVAKIEVPNEFHYANKDLTASINIRGFTEFQNIDIEWAVVDKKGNPIPEEQIEVHNNATMTIKNPDSGDYTITASYEGIQLDKLTVQVRYVDMNKFLRANIWWVVLITLSFVALSVFLSFVTKRGKTTVEHIERVYGVYCQCMSNDTLSKDELKRIRREIARCLRRCEDLNIDALNQYEKATRYLRKSLNDTNAMLKKFDTFTPEEREILSNLLDKDLSKALNVAKEIEAAKDLIESYHAKANRNNYEKLVEEPKNKKKKD